jgi:lipoate-protein ligase A
MIELPRFDGRDNMAKDAELLHFAEGGEPGWRVYGWDGPWVSLGCFQIPLRDLLDPDSIRWVMRPTGGKAVLHGHDVTVGLALPLAALAKISGEPEERLARSLKAVYRMAIAPIVSALRHCGLPAVLGEDLRGSSRSPSPLHPPALRDKGGARVADCFAVTSPNDVVHERTGMKVCGCALRLTERAVLVQASIPAGQPLIDPYRVFANPNIIPLSQWDGNRFLGTFEREMTLLLRMEALSP